MYAPDGYTFFNAYVHVFENNRNNGTVVVVVVGMYQLLKLLLFLSQEFVAWVLL